MFPPEPEPDGSGSGPNCLLVFQMMDEEATKRYVRPTEDGPHQNPAQVKPEPTRTLKPRPPPEPSVTMTTGASLRSWTDSNSLCN